MNQLGISDPMAAFISTSSPKEEKNYKRNRDYSKEFQAMLDSLEQEDEEEETSIVTGKKRRLSFEQVKALEKNFCVEKKIEPERKLKLAQELGLSPRQVAIWFQNRRARWKAKQLEVDYGVLEANYGDLKINFHHLEQEKEALTKELEDLKTKLNDSVLKQIKNRESSSSGAVQPLITEATSWPNSSGSSSSSSSGISMNWFQLLDFRSISLKMEEQSIFGTDVSCNLFSVDQPPNLHFYLDEQ